MSVHAKLLALAAAGFLAMMPSLDGARADHRDDQRRAGNGDGRLVVTYESGQRRQDGRYNSEHRRGQDYGDQRYRQQKHATAHRHGHKNKHKYANQRHHSNWGHAQGQGYKWGNYQRQQVSCRSEYLRGKRNHRRALFLQRVCVDRSGFTFVATGSRQFVGFIAH